MRSESHRREVAYAWWLRRVNRVAHESSSDAAVILPTNWRMTTAQVDRSESGTPSRAEFTYSVREG